MKALTPEVQAIIDRALEEDQAFHDPTTEALIPPDLAGMGIVRSKAQGVLAGVEVALAVFRRLDPSLETEALLQDGARLRPGDDIARVRGSVFSILRAERTALNFLQRMSGIATMTWQYIKAVEGYPVRIVDTRKTAPGLRPLDKYAVRVGGGHNHRLNLLDGILIKDNHITALRSQGYSLGEMVRKALAQAPHTIKVEVEVTSVEEAVEAVEAGAHIVMLDNMGLEEMEEAVRAVNKRALVEASGGVTLENVRAVAATGVDLISIGALTHSVKALDISLDVEV